MDDDDDRLAHGAVFADTHQPVGYDPPPSSSNSQGKGGDASISSVILLVIACAILAVSLAHVLVSYRLKGGGMRHTRLEEGVSTRQNEAEVSVELQPDLQTVKGATPASQSQHEIVSKPEQQLEDAVSSCRDSGRHKLFS